MNVVEAALLHAEKNSLVTSEAIWSITFDTNFIHLGKVMLVDDNIYVLVRLATAPLYFDAAKVIYMQLK